MEIVHTEEIDDTLGDAQIRKQLIGTLISLSFSIIFLDLRESEARIILLYSTSIRIRPLFNMAKSLGLLSQDYLWIGTQSVKGSMNSAVPPIQQGMLTVNFHTVSQSMFPPPDDVLPMIIGLAPKLFGLGLAKLNPSVNTSFQSTASCNQLSEKWELGGPLYE